MSISSNQVHIGVSQVRNPQTNQSVQKYIKELEETLEKLRVSDKSIGACLDRLSLSDQCDDVAIKTTWKQLVVKYHPDKLPIKRSDNGYDVALKLAKDIFNSLTESKEKLLTIGRDSRIKASQSSNPHQSQQSPEADYTPSYDWSYSFFNCTFNVFENDRHLNKIFEKARKELAALRKQKQEIHAESIQLIASQGEAYRDTLAENHHREMEALRREKEAIGSTVHRSQHNVMSELPRKPIRFSELNFDSFGELASTMSLVLRQPIHSSEPTVEPTYLRDLERHTDHIAEGLNHLNTSTEKTESIDTVIKQWELFLSRITSRQPGSLHHQKIKIEAESRELKSGLDALKLHIQKNYVERRWSGIPYIFSYDYFLKPDSIASLADLYDKHILPKIKKERQLFLEERTIQKVQNMSVKLDSFKSQWFEIKAKRIDAEEASKLLEVKQKYAEDMRVLEERERREKQHIEHLKREFENMRNIQQHNRAGLFSGDLICEHVLFDDFRLRFCQKEAVVGAYIVKIGVLTDTVSHFIPLDSIVDIPREISSEDLQDRNNWDIVVLSDRIGLRFVGRRRYFSS